MTFDPVRRCAPDIETLRAARPLPEEVALERGQSWSVDRSTRGCWTVSGVAFGFTVVGSLYDAGFLNPLRPIPGMDLVWSLVCANVSGLVAGGALGYLAASILQRIWRGLRT